MLHTLASALLTPVIAPQLEARGGEGVLWDCRLTYSQLLTPCVALVSTPRVILGAAFEECSVMYGECIMAPGTLTTLTGTETP